MAETCLTTARLPPLCVIPTLLSEPADVATLDECLRTLRATAGRELDVLVVDDGSPARAAVELVDSMRARWGFELHRKSENTGFSQTVNVGLRQALREGRDAILVNADIVFCEAGWAQAMARTASLGDGKPAWVVGALLSYPGGCVQEAGIYFGLLSRSFDHLWKFQPEPLPDTLRQRTCAVSGALQLIRHECLAEIGLYDESFALTEEDVDYCVRVFKAGRECVCNPQARASHHESLVRRRASAQILDWEARSRERMAAKLRQEDLAATVPSWVGFGNRAAIVVPRGHERDVRYVQLTQEDVVEPVSRPQGDRDTASRSPPLASRTALRDRRTAPA